MIDTYQSGIESHSILGIGERYSQPGPEGFLPFVMRFSFYPSTAVFKELRETKSAL